MILDDVQLPRDMSVTVVGDLTNSELLAAGNLDKEEEEDDDPAPPPQTIKEKFEMLNAFWRFNQENNLTNPTFEDIEKTIFYQANQGKKQNKLQITLCNKITVCT